MYAPIVYFPCYYTATGAIQGLGVEECLVRYAANLGADMADSVSFWGPVQMLNFCLLPIHARVPFMCAFGTAWLGYLSLKRGGGGGGDGDASEAPRISVRARGHGVDAGHELAVA